MVDKEAKLKKLIEASHLAAKIHKLCAEENGDMRTAFLAGLLYTGGVARATGLSLHETMSAMMAVYKDAEKFMDKAKDDL